MHSTDDTGRRWVIAKSGKRYWFDQGSADAACAFFPTYLRHTKGEWFGQPFHLTRWERRIIRKIFGWKRADGTRRYRRLWLELPRKNGKTEFAAGIALLLMVADGEPGAEIYSLASEEGQARIVFERANIMVGMSDELSAEVERFKTSLYCAALQSSFKPLTALPNSKQGFSPSGFIGDEVHVWISGDLADAVHEGEGTRAQPLDVLITTAGEIDTYAHEQHDYAVSVLKDEIEDDELMAVIFAAGDDADWTDPKIHRLANPSYDVTVKPSFFDAECRKARNLPRLENRFRRYYLNQWVEQTTRWLPMEFWDVCTAAPLAKAKSLFLSDPDRDELLREKLQSVTAPDPDYWKKLPDMLAGQPCCGGLDLMSTTDIAALCLAFPPTKERPRTAFLWRFYLPVETLKATAKDIRQRYEQWAASGALTLTPGNVMDYEFIQRDVLDWCGKFRFGHLAIDRWNATQLAVNLAQQDGLNVEMFGQGFRSMSGPSKEFERLVLGIGIEHGNNPVARWMAKNVAVETDAHDNIKPVKPSSADAKGRGRGRKSNAKVDGIVAGVMGLAMMMAKPESGESIYDIEAREALARNTAEVIA